MGTRKELVYDYQWTVYIQRQFLTRPIDVKELAGRYSVTLCPPRCVMVQTLGFENRRDLGQQESQLTAAAEMTVSVQWLDIVEGVGN